MLLIMEPFQSSLPSRSEVLSGECAVSDAVCLSREVNTNVIVPKFKFFAGRSVMGQKKETIKEARKQNRCNCVRWQTTFRRFNVKMQTGRWYQEPANLGAEFSFNVSGIIAVALIHSTISRLFLLLVDQCCLSLLLLGSSAWMNQINSILAALPPPPPSPLHLHPPDHHPCPAPSPVRSSLHPSLPSPSLH